MNDRTAGEVLSRPVTRREAVATALALGASLAWPIHRERRPLGAWRECRDCYPQGVASGDPTADGVILWTRRPPTNEGSASRLLLEIASDEQFRHVVSTAHANVSAATDWTCRVLVAGLPPAREYWYRFTDEHGNGSRVGRTLTTPTPSDRRPVQFAFVSCQNNQLGACNAYRRMIWEDERRAPADRLSFVLHLGDFVYEVVWYPEDRPQGYYARRIRDIVRYAHGEQHNDFHVPTTVDDYRALYRAYLLDPDLQDARARWPFVPVPDNHEFSWKGWQSQESFGTTLPAETRKVAANQAWFEYQPARVVRPGAPNANEFRAPRVTDAPLRQIDDHGLGVDPDNLAAIRSLRVYRTLRLGANAEMILTDNRSFRSEPLTTRAEAAPFRPTAFPGVVSEDVTETLDAGAAVPNAPRTIRFGGVDVPNPRRTAQPLSMLAATQKEWFLDQLRSAPTPWKLWGNSVATLDWRTDFQNLPDDVAARWPTSGYALFGDDDWSGYRHERAEILDFVERNGITGLATVCGDRHAFLAGVVSATLPPRRFHPVGVEFVTGSISAPGLFEAMEFGLPRDHLLRAAYVHQPPGGAAAEPAINLSMMHGVRSSLELQRTHDLRLAVAATNAEVAPHLSFADTGGHGYAVVRVAPDDLTVEFVCIPRPIERSATADGGPLAYRVSHRVRLWAAGETPKVVRASQEGVLPLVV